MEKSKQPLSQLPSHNNGDTIEVANAIDPILERRLKRKADFIIIPTLAITYLFKLVFPSDNLGRSI